MDDGGRFGPGDVRFFDRTAGLYDLAMPAAPADAVRAALAEARRPVELVVDLAGGTGRATAALDAPDDPEVVVVDASAEMLGAARAGVSRVRGDAARLPLSPADGGRRGVDAVVVADALHHVPEGLNALAEAARALEPGGVLVVRDFDPTTLRGGAVAGAEAALQMGSTFRTPSAVCELLADVGLRPTPLSEGWVYTVVGRKPTW
ncbi:MAG: class I SAM-dependent methyltransferase [Halolamina sp.]